MKEIIAYNGEKIIVSDEDYTELNKYSWYIGGDGYAARTGSYKVHWQGIKLHHHILPRKKGLFVDHINGNKLDNRRDNLRYATPSQNMVNQKVRSDNKTGYKGVSPVPSGKFIAQVTMHGKRVHLGTFNTAKEAALAYNKAAIAVHGEFARLNIIKEEE